MPRQLPLLERDADSALCCTPLSTAPLDVGEADLLAKRLKAIADPVRLRLLSLLLASDDASACTCDLTGPLGLSQPTVSHHLRTLAKAGLVRPTRRGTRTDYTVIREALIDISDVIRPPAAASR